MTQTLPPALPGERVTFESAGARVSAYVAGQGPPMLLVHSVNAAGSAAEVRPLHAHYVGTHTVVSLDLPGFGFSDRSDRAYTPQLMAQAIVDALEWMRSRCGDAPVDALALSLSCEYLARAALDVPQRLASVALVSPTGLGAGPPRLGPAGGNLGKAWLLRLLRGFGTGRSVFDALTQPSVIRYFLKRTWGSPHIDEPLWRYDLHTVAPAGAQHAPLRFISGYLFSTDAQALYERLTLPVWMCHGVRGDFTNYTRAEAFRSRPHWRITVLPTGALPHFEALRAFTQAWDAARAQALQPIRSSGASV